MKSVTISKRQKQSYNRLGLRLLKKGYITGYQIEDYNPGRKRILVYGHDSPSHLKQVKQNIKGHAYPRESYYKWRKSYKKGENTTLLYNRQLAYAREGYLATAPLDRNIRFIEKKAVHGRQGAIPMSWVTPDVRLYGIRKRYPAFKNAWLVTKRIDPNSRFSTLIVEKANIKPVKDSLKNERLTMVRIQNFRPKEHSLWKFIHTST